MGYRIVFLDATLSMSESVRFERVRQRNLLQPHDGGTVSSERAERDQSTITSKRLL